MATSSFVPFVPAPESVSISGRPAVAVRAWWSHRSGSVVTGAAFVDGPGGEALCVSFDAGLPLWCWRSAFSSAADWSLLLASVDSAVLSGAVVFPVVACGLGRPARASGVPLHGWFCGLSGDSVVRDVVPVGGLVSG